MEQAKGIGLGLGPLPELDGYSIPISVTPAGDQDQPFPASFLLLNTSAPTQWSTPHWLISTKAIILRVVTFLRRKNLIKIGSTSFPCLDSKFN